MSISLHEHEYTTPDLRAEISAGTESVSELVRRYHVKAATIRKGQSRTDFQERLLTAHHLQTTLVVVQEAIVVHLCKTQRLPLDDFLVVTRELLCPEVSRPGLDHCLHHHEVGNLRTLHAARGGECCSSAFNAYLSSHLKIYINYLPQLAVKTSWRYLLVLWVYLAIHLNNKAAAKAFLKAPHWACPVKIARVLTDNGKGFTDRPFGSLDRQPTGRHEFDQLCEALGIEHRLTRPRTPQTNGMIEYFNGCISDILKTYPFLSGEDLEETCCVTYVFLCNKQLSQSALGSQTPT